jgi:hypothetical protein
MREFRSRLVTSSVSRYLRRSYDACSSAKQSLDLASVIPDRDGAKFQTAELPAGTHQRSFALNFAHH